MRPSAVREIDPPARDWRSFSWRDGGFDTAHRTYTRAVEGQIRMPHHLILVTLSGGAGDLEVDSECGHHYKGKDFAGAVSFVPAGCGRQFRMRGVRSEWASISLRPEFLLDHSVENGCETGIEIPTFTNQRGPFILALIQEIKRQHVLLGRLAPEYCDVMSAALARYLCGRYGSRDVRSPGRPMKLPPWRLRWLTEYVNDRLDRAISTAEIASEIGISVRHLHRASSSLALSSLWLCFPIRDRLGKPDNFV
jgi:AraC family transcriptional regulator